MTSPSDQGNGDKWTLRKSEIWFSAKTFALCLVLNGYVGRSGRREQKRKKKKKERVKNKELVAVEEKKDGKWSKGRKKGK